MYDVPIISNRGLNYIVRDQFIHIVYQMSQKIIQIIIFTTDYSFNFVYCLTIFEVDIFIDG